MKHLAAILVACTLALPALATEPTREELIHALVSLRSYAKQTDTSLEEAQRLGGEKQREIDEQRGQFVQTATQLAAVQVQLLSERGARITEMERKERWRWAALAGWGAIAAYFAAPLLKRLFV